MGLFYYKQFQLTPPIEEGGKPGMVEVTDAINPDNIHRLRTYPDGSTVVLLNDGHEQVQETPITTKTGVKRSVSQKTYVQSEIRLSAEDSKRLKELTEILTTEEQDKIFADLNLGWDNSGKQVSVEPDSPEITAEVESMEN